MNNVYLIIIIVFHLLPFTDVSWRRRSEKPHYESHASDSMYTIQWKYRLPDYESVTKLLCLLRAIRLTGKGHNCIRIYHIIYSWYRVIRMWLMGYSQISNTETRQLRGASERSELIKLDQHEPLYKNWS